MDDLNTVLRAAVKSSSQAESAAPHRVEKQEIALEDSLSDLAVAEKLGSRPVADESVVLVAAKVIPERSRSLPRR